MGVSEKPSALAAGQLTLSLDGRSAICADMEVIRVEKADEPALAQVEVLEIPRCVRAFHGLNRFESLRLVRYAGEADVFEFDESLSWLAEKGSDTYAFLNRIATNLLAFRPISETLIAIVAPHMTPIQALPSYQKILKLLDDRVSPLSGLGFYRQDDSRQNAMLCNSYAQIKRLEWAFYEGFAFTEEPFDPAVSSCYLPENRLSAHEQLLYLFCMLQGHSYREFYSNVGEHGYGNIAAKTAYMEDLRPLPKWEDTVRFQKQLRLALRAGFLTWNNYRAAVSLLSSHHLTESTAIVLEYGDRHPDIRGGTDAAGDNLSFLDDELGL